MIPTIVSVLRSGGDFVPEDVLRLHRCVARNLKAPHRFVCLTDQVNEVAAIADIEAIPLVHNWPGWWAKMETFRIPGPALYLDLDTVVVGDLTGLVDLISSGSGDLFGIRDFYHDGFQTGLMGWAGDASRIGLAFEREMQIAQWVSRAGCCQTLKSLGHRFAGDADWLRLTQADVFVKVRYLQDEFPGIVSYKVHVWKRGELPDGARIVCFHGHPRPAFLHPGPQWLRDAWKENL